MMNIFNNEAFSFILTLKSGQFQHQGINSTNVHACHIFTIVIYLV